MHRVTLEVEEQVIRVGRGQAAEPEAGEMWQQLVDAARLIDTLPLQPRLLDQTRERLGADARHAPFAEAAEQCRGRGREPPSDAGAGGG